MVDISIHVHDGNGPETGSLTCAHCKLPHPVAPAMQAHYEAAARAYGVASAWQCGACYLAELSWRTGMPPVKLRTDCDHPVPPFPVETRGGR